MNEKSIATPIASQGHTDVGKSAIGSASMVAETVGERLKQVYPEHYVRIITLMNEDAGAEKTAKTLSSTRVYPLSIAFEWSKTDEGWNFWAKLSKREG